MDAPEDSIIGPCTQNKPGHTRRDPLTLGQYIIHNELNFQSLTYAHAAQMHASAHAVSCIMFFS